MGTTASLLLGKVINGAVVVWVIAFFANELLFAGSLNRALFLTLFVPLSLVFVVQGLRGNLRWDGSDGGGDGGHGCDDNGGGCDGGGH